LHEGNLAFRPGLVLAPAYGMLPMMYVTARGGEAPVKLWEISSEDESISPDFRRTCGAAGFW
jgi:hypothetical protein